MLTYDPEHILLPFYWYLWGKYLIWINDLKNRIVKNIKLLLHTLILLRCKCIEISGYDSTILTAVIITVDKHKLLFRIIY